MELNGLAVKLQVSVRSFSLYLIVTVTNHLLTATHSHSYISGDTFHAKKT